MEQRLLPPPDGEGKGRAGRSTKAEVRSRVTVFVNLILAGAGHRDLLAYASQKGWGVSRATVKWYTAKAHRYLQQNIERRRDRVVAVHENQRQRLFFLALQAGELSLAHSILIDLAKLQGLYDAAKGRFTDDEGEDSAASGIDEAIATLRSILDPKPEANGTEGGGQPPQS